MSLRTVQETAKGALELGLDELSKEALIYLAASTPETGIQRWQIAQSLGVGPLTEFTKTYVLKNHKRVSDRFISFFFAGLLANMTTSTRACDMVAGKKRGLHSSHVIFTRFFVQSCYTD